MKSLQELEKIRQEAKTDMIVRDEHPLGRITVGMSTCGIAAGARQILKILIEELDKVGLQEIQVAQTGCAGMCDREPLVDVALKGSQVYTYGEVTQDKLKQIIDQHVVKGKPIYDWVVKVQEDI